MAKATDNRLDQFFTTVRILIDGIQNDTALTQTMTTLGYGPAQWAAGRSLYDEALNLHAQQKKEYGDQFEATRDLNAAWDKAEAAYRRTRNLARVAFRDDPQAQATLLLGAGRGESLSAWLDQSRQFYQNLSGHPALLKSMERFGLTEDQVKAEQALVTDVEARQTHQRTQTREAQEATESREVQIKKLDRWYIDLRDVAKVAFGDRPQVMQNLGLAR